MPGLPIPPAHEVIRALSSQRFQVVSQKGRHIEMKKTTPNFGFRGILISKSSIDFVCNLQLNLKSLKKEAIPPSALKFLQLSAKEILRKRRLKI